MEGFCRYVESGSVSSDPHVLQRITRSTETQKNQEQKHTAEKEPDFCWQRDIVYICRASEQEKKERKKLVSVLKLQVRDSLFSCFSCFFLFSCL